MNTHPMTLIRNIDDNSKHATNPKLIIYRITDIKVKDSKIKELNRKEIIHYKSRNYDFCL